jgi:hypothetical protein
MLGTLALAVVLVPAPATWFYAESNSGETSLSYGFSSTGVSNDPKTSLVATVHDGRTFPGGHTMVFDCDKRSHLSNETGSWPATVTTDSKGQGRVVVFGSKLAPVEKIAVTMRWYKPDGSFAMDDAVTVYLGSWSENNQVPPQLPQVPAVANPCAIRYAENVSWFLGYSAQARNDWTASGRVGFQQSNQNFQVLFDDNWCEPASAAYAQTEFGPNDTHIHYNRWNLDGDPTRSGACPGNKFPRVSWRHHNKVVAVHELGHALALDHVSNLGSIVYPSIDNYLKLGTESSSSYDRVRINQLYPNPCN